MDMIRGIAVLDDRPGVPQRLFVVCCAENYPRIGARTFIQSIPVHAEGMPRYCDPCWTYRTEGELMHLFPSLHVTVKSWNEATQRCDGPPETLFHNGYNWTTKFVRWTEDCARRGIAADDDDIRSGRWELCRALNESLFSTAFGS